MNYTLKMVEKLTSSPILTYRAAKNFAEEFNLPIASVLAKARGLNIEYEGKPLPKRTTKTKDEMAKDIESLLGVEIKSLNKLLKPDLETLSEVLHGLIEG